MTDHRQLEPPRAAWRDEHERLDSATVRHWVIFLFVGAGLARTAGADGAFPDEFQLFLPPTSGSVVVAASFGLISSVNGSAPWTFACEAQTGLASVNVSLYQMGPTGTLLADSPDGILRSEDSGCSWHSSTGTLAGVFAWDAAFDILNPGSALALGANGSVQNSAIYPSGDDGRSFGAAVYEVTGFLTGIEFAPSQPGTVYATGNEGNGGSLGAPFVLASADRGQTWPQKFDHPELGAVFLRLAAVDSADASTIYFRISPGSGGDSLAVSHDGGQTIAVLTTLAEPMTAFLKSHDGTLYVGTRNSTGQGGLFAGPGFAAVSAIHVRCLGERGDVLYACGDDLVDHFALGASGDGGRTFTPVLAFNQITGLAACSGDGFSQACGPVWSALEQFFGIDAGVVTSADGRDGGAGVDAGEPSNPLKGGCSCAGDDASLAWALLAGVGWRLRPARRKA